MSKHQIPDTSLAGHWGTVSDFVLSDSPEYEDDSLIREEDYDSILVHVNDVPGLIAWLLKSVDERPDTEHRKGLHTKIAHVLHERECKRRAEVNLGVPASLVVSPEQLADIKAFRKNPDPDAPFGYWLTGKIEDAEHLKSLGCRLGPYDGEDFRNCILDTFKLDSYWCNRYLWGPEKGLWYPPKTSLDVEVTTVFTSVVYFREPHACKNGKEGQYGTTDGESIRCAFCGEFVKVEEDPILTVSTPKKE